METIKCFICSKIFESKPHLMNHRKKDHSDVVKPCTQFRQNNCRFRSEACWFKHEENLSKDGIQSDTNEEKEDNKRDNKSQKDFQKVSDDLDPPIMNKMKNQKL